MAVFLVTPLSQNFELIQSALIRLNMDFYALQGQAGFLVSDTGTSEEISNKIGITTSNGNERVLGSALVTRVSSYFGIGFTGMWEWIQSRMEKAG